MVQIKLKYVNGFANRDRRNQRVRYYFRRHGTKAIPLPGLPGSEEFMVAYAAALASVPDQHLEIAANLDRSVGPFPLPRVLWHLPNRCSGAIDDRACTQPRCTSPTRLDHETDVKKWLIDRHRSEKSVPQATMVGSFI
jgi:hypothetical protein